MGGDETDCSQAGVGGGCSQGCDCNWVQGQPHDVPDTELADSGQV